MARSKSITAAEDLCGAFARCLDGEAIAPRPLPPDALIGLCIPEPVPFALTFLRLLDQGRTPVIFPSEEECSAFHIPFVMTSTGLQRHTGGSPLLPPRPGSYYAFSSGTTGKRKPLLFSARRGLDNAQAHARSLGIGPEHSILQALPLQHSFGIIAYLFTPLVTGARVVLGSYFDSMFSQPPEQLGRSVVHLTPEHLHLLRRRNVKLSGQVAKLSVGAGPLRRGDAEYAAGLCMELFTTYGLSEAGPRVTTGRVRLDRFVDGWIGYLLEGIQARLEDDGELWIRSPYAVTDDFFNTGDRVNRLDDGSYVFHNRCADVLRLRGQTRPRLAYSQKLQDLLGLPCEVAQRRYSDEVVVFWEGTQDDPAVADRVRGTYPELRDACFHRVECFQRTVLGKPDLAAMLARMEEG